MKVVGIDTRPKPVDSCQFCGHVPACPALTCSRLKYLELFDDGSLAAVEYFETWTPPKGDEPAE